jgi:hypothetical protein
MKRVSFRFESEQKHFFPRSALKIGLNLNRVVSSKPRGLKLILAWGANKVNVCASAALNPE